MDREALIEGWAVELVIELGNDDEDIPIIIKALTRAFDEGINACPPTTGSPHKDT